MNGSWSTVWDIAGKRHSTNMGEDHLSEHAHEVLQGFVISEAQDAMASALGGAWKRADPEFP